MALDQSIIRSLGISEMDLFKGVINDIQKVFSIMVGRDDLLHLPMMIAPTSRLNDCVTAMVGMTGTCNGMVSLHVPDKLALDFASGMLDTEVAVLDDDVRDAIGEIASMIAGAFKQYISPGGTDVRLSTPSVIAGREYSFFAGKPDENLMLCFACNQASFVTNLFLKGTQERQGIGREWGIHAERSNEIFHHVH